MKRRQPQPPHKRGTLHRRLQPLYTEKRTVSCAGFLPKTSPMQRLCSQHNAFCSTTWLTRIRTELRTQEQPLVAEHRGGNNSRMKRPQPQPPHTRGTIHCRPKPLYTEKRTVSCAGFLPKTSPMQRLCSQHNAFCSTAWLTRIRTELRTQEQPLVAEHRGGNNSRMKRPQPQPPHTRGTIHRRPKPLYTEKRTVSCSGFLPKTSPMHSCSQYIAFCSITWLTRIFLRTWRQSMTTIMQPFQCDPQPEIQETHRTTHTGTTTRCRTQEEEPIHA